MVNLKNSFDKSLLPGYYNWLISSGRSQSTAKAYFLEVSRCVALAGNPCSEGKVFHEIALSYVNNGSLSIGTRKRRYHALSLFCKFSGQSFSVKRPVQPCDPSSPFYSPSLKGCIEATGLSSGTSQVIEPVLSLSLTQNTRRRWRLTTLRNRAMTLLVVVCKIKNSEMIELTTDSISIDGKSAFIRKISGSIALPDVVRTAILEYLVARHGRKLDSPFLFINSRGGPLSIRTAQYGVKRYLKDCGNSDSVSSTGIAPKKYDELVANTMTKALLRKLTASK